MAEWLCSGLQIRLSRFDSGFRLHIAVKTHRYHTCTRRKPTQCPGGEIGRHKGFKIPRTQVRAGSSPAPGTIYCLNQSLSLFLFLSSINFCSQFFYLICFSGMCTSRPLQACCYTCNLSLVVKSYNYFVRGWTTFAQRRER